MKIFFLTLTILIFGGNLFAQDATAQEKVNQIQQQINQLEQQMKKSPCWKNSQCPSKDYLAYQPLQQQRDDLTQQKKIAEERASGKRPSEAGELAQNFANSIFYLVILIIFGGIPLIFIIWLIFRKKSVTNYSDAHGSAAWATDEELKKKGFIKPEIESGNLLIGNQDNKNLVVLPEEINFRHTTVLGPSGTGKSRFFFMPNLYYLRDKVSMFVHDTKGELWEATSGHWNDAIRLAPYDPDNSMPFNWIPYCTDENSLLTIDLAETIITNGRESKTADSFWEDSEVALLAGIFSHIATTDCPTPAYAYDIITTLNLEQLIDVMRDSNSKFANEQANFVEDAPDRVKQAILTGVRRTLNWLRDEKVRRFTSSVTWKANLDILRKGKIAIYWCLPQTYSERLRPLTCLALKLLMFQLRQSKGENVYLLLDEFDALGRIPRFESDLTLLRSENVAVIAGIQSIAQLAKNYGRESAQVIFDNLQTKITLHGLEYETAERISKNLGEFTLTENSVSTSSSLLEKTSTTVSERKHARRLMTADEVRRLDESLALTITSNVKPFVKAKMLFNSDTPPTVKKRCGETKTRPVKRGDTKNHQSDTIPDFPDLIAE
jgi:type IV secretion system protein VirD4